ncbi:hypothetical protein LR48_Vigan10g113000 [Vigna angularis]|uniref:Uncharacterized protein n=1 Tax=Phaseolus angularis TaxID=3914 RepID=A0A0L9VJS1_PHAAN|nr:hypothetical protein LR48_Vigan10g113000 [Vigna angularis]
MHGKTNVREQEGTYQSSFVNRTSSLEVLDAERPTIVPEYRSKEIKLGVSFREKVQRNEERRRRERVFRNEAKRGVQREGNISDSELCFPLCQRTSHYASARYTLASTCSTFLVSNSPYRTVVHSESDTCNPLSRTHVHPDCPCRTHVRTLRFWLNSTCDSWHPSVGASDAAAAICAVEVARSLAATWIPPSGRISEA